MIKLFEENHLFGKIQVVDILKLAQICNMIISGAWYAFHTMQKGMMSQLCYHSNWSVRIVWPGNFIGVEFKGHT